MRPARECPGWPPPGYSFDDPIETHEQLVKVASGLGFHMPGWTVEWRTDPLPAYRGLSGSILALTCKTFDTYTYRPGDERRPDKMITIAHASRVPEWLRVGDLPEWFRRTVHAALQHEADEWLRVRGWMAWNPHGQAKYVPIAPPPPQCPARWF